MVLVILILLMCVFFLHQKLIFENVRVCTITKVIFENI